MIKEFKGDYSLLSNFYISPFEFKSIIYQTVEHFYQSMKATNKEDHDKILNAKTPREARTLGKSIKMRSDWELVKVRVMEIALKLKFSNPILRKKLLETYPKILAEGNNWKDTFWGIDIISGKGSNILGILLMKLRAELRLEDLEKIKI